MIYKPCLSPLLKYYPSLALLPLSGWSDSQTVTHIWKTFILLQETACIINFYNRNCFSILEIMMWLAMLRQFAYKWNIPLFLKLKTANSGRDMVILIQSSAVFYGYVGLREGECTRKHRRTSQWDVYFPLALWSWQLASVRHPSVQCSAVSTPKRKSSWLGVGRQRSSKQSLILIKPISVVE